MVLQELDLQIDYRPGKANAKADALSRYPVSLLREDVNQTQTCSLVATLEVAATQSEHGEGSSGETLRERQQEDPRLSDIMTYSETGDLPQDKRRAQELVLASSMFTIQDGILYKVEKDKTLRIVPPSRDRQKRFMEVHQGPFSGHLREAKIHGQLSKHYWWPHMRKDISHWCRACLTCASRNVCSPARPPLTPISVGGPFDRVGVDVLQLPKTARGNKYAIVFVDYLTKWPEVFAAPDQMALTISKLFVEEIISHHGVRNQLLSDRGPAFLSRLLLIICECMGVKKVNTSAYHPQFDGLVESFNRTLTEMLYMSVPVGTKEWDDQLPYVLMAYRATLQASTNESPFFLLYGRDPKLPSETLLSVPTQREVVKLYDYKSMMIREMGASWDLARKAVTKAQNRQKHHHDKKAKNTNFKIGERVFVQTPAVQTEPLCKLSRPFKDPYRVTALYPNGADIILIGKPGSDPIQVALNRLRWCPEEIEEDPPPELGTQEGSTAGNAGSEPPPDIRMPAVCLTNSGLHQQLLSEQAKDVSCHPEENGTPTFRRPNVMNQPLVWRSRLRPRKISSRTNQAVEGQM